LRAQILHLANVATLLGTQLSLDSAHRLATMLYATQKIADTTKAPIAYPNNSHNSVPLSPPIIGVIGASAIAIAATAPNTKFTSANTRET
jgi:hypothetical protein